MSENTPEGPDEIEDKDFAVLDGMMPAEAARILRRVMRKAKNAAQPSSQVTQALQDLVTGHQSQKTQIETLQATMDSQTTAIQQLNTARSQQATRITDLTTRVTALEARFPKTV